MTLVAARFLLVILFLGVAGAGDDGEILLDEGDFAEIIIPHADIAAVTSVARVAVAIGEMSGFIERGRDVGGEEPFTATAGGSDWGDGFNIGYPTAATVIAIE